MYKNGAPIRNKKGKIVGGYLMDERRSGGQLRSKGAAGQVSRVAPNRRWFGNTRTVGQNQLEKFREELGDKINDPYQVVLRSKQVCTCSALASLAHPNTFLYSCSYLWASSKMLKNYRKCTYCQRNHTKTLLVPDPDGSVPNYLPCHCQQPQVEPAE